MQTEPTDDAVEDTVTEINDIINSSSRTVQDLTKIAGSLVNVAGALSTDIPIAIRNEVSTPTHI